MATKKKTTKRASKKKPKTQVVKVGTIQAVAKPIPVPAAETPQPVAPQAPAPPPDVTRAWNQAVAACISKVKEGFPGHALGDAVANLLRTLLK